MARFEAGPLLDIATRYAVTTLCAPPTVWRMLAQEDLRRWQTHFRELAAAGEPLNPEIIAQFRSAWGLTIRDGYGQTETTAQIGNPPGQALKPGSMGRPLPGYRVALLDLDDQPAREGEICLPTDPRPAGLMLGYQGDDGAALPVVGIYRTGDVATIDDEGYLTFVGRTDDVFKSSDYRISPFELESVLIEHPSVVEAAVVPSPDPLRLAVPKAYVTLAAGVPPDRETALSIFRHTHASLAPYKRLRRIEFAPELPKTISGKIRRTELRARETNEKTPGLSNPEFISSEFPELKVGNEG
jgi:acetyl-CoA synthetase